MAITVTIGGFEYKRVNQPFRKRLPWNADDLSEETQEIALSVYSGWDSAPDAARELIESVGESNAIEGVYDALSIEDSVGAFQYLVIHSILNENVIRRAHKMVMRNQPILSQYKGYYRDCYVTVGGRLCPNPASVPYLMENWLADMQLSKKEADFIEDHVAFEKIHPFVDGNGRLGRLILNWQRWIHGLHPLIILESEKNAYYHWFR